ncbi:MAG TPA: TorF family putative porin, partial [Rubrivivax sp.]|nr:TorF family putative porin [Rubrivivax sp.]
MTTRTTTIGLVALLAMASLPAFAQSAPASDWTFSGNAGLYSDYRFRGISQTNKKPAFQGGFDVGHASGFYVGNWNSNIDSSFYGGSNLEMDFYGGFRGAVDVFSYDVGVLYYAYPGSD